MRSRPGGTHTTQDRAWLDGRGLGSRRVRAWAFGSSLVAHVVAILLYSSVVSILRPDAVDFSLPSDAGSERGVEVIRIIDLDESLDPDRPDDPREIADVTAPATDVRRPVIGGPPRGELVPPAPTAAERLRPNLTDARLWAALPPEFYELTLEQREELLLSARIVEWYDSVALVRAAEGRLTDWTFRDGSGGRWGFADGRMYLGDVAVPLPLNFGTPVGKRDEVNRLLWEYEEISRQSQRFLIEESWKERAAAMRARRDRERAAAADTIGGA